jgi:hypothetical protein
MVSEDIDNLVSMNNAYSFANARKHEATLATDPIGHQTSATLRFNQPQGPSVLHFFKCH